MYTIHKSGAAKLFLKNVVIHLYIVLYKRGFFNSKLNYLTAITMHILIFFGYP